MSTDDRKATNDAPDSDANAPIQDLTATNLDEAAAAEVKGGASTVGPVIHSGSASYTPPAPVDTAASPNSTDTQSLIDHFRG